ncbi:MULTISPECIES: aryl-sulfate sulfotransferase [Enterococcus]|uniref:Aryl-sulfate sulfotransferase n=1 Tax=Enterococcus raffinosus TaxID=71452 RepID=A0AAP5KCP9_9ENTE|nr:MULTISPECIES: aryl-sulfate sulfotransferase [Enterococcus]SAM73176.1 Arylsulfate sulfotransferase AssT precursor [Enterococcus faecium]MBS6432034.1 aryl-sulfate sulfotransferase [Enterococcus raffinosus]MDK7989229.1 aryl-sulfate sulfotransferase [Enterococcus raffinosus]MDT2524118.1 aryl-sulfate sulfotransferase [Enterococcus raffinosus]MDT2534901.1 aryl-sulfate sulfotransferase [Enterococcus raffinosus]
MKGYLKRTTFFIGLLVCLAGCSVSGTVSNETEPEELSVTLNEDWQEDQSEKEKEYQELLKSGDYNEDNIYVKVDPYDASPLSALLLFQTEEAIKVEISVAGKDDESTIKNSFDDYTTDHSIPVLGLYADKENEVTVKLTNEAGTSVEKKLTIKTGALAKSIADIEVNEADTEKMALGDSELTFVVPSTKRAYAFDANGDVRWYSTRYNSHIFKELANGNLLYLTKEANDADTYNVLLETDYLGKIYNRYDFSSSSASNDTGESKGEMTVIHHDGIELPSGNLLLTVNDGSNYIEDTMIELNRETGEIEKTIDLKDLLPESFYEEYDSTSREDGKIDWFHQNSVDYDEADNSIIISGRHQDTIMKIDYATNEIKWIMGDSSGWPESYQKYFLDGDVKASGGQHAAIVLPDQDDNAETTDILYYDNNISVTRGDEADSEKYSEARQVRINEEDRTIEEVWTFGEDLGEAYFTKIIGSARYLADNGNRLVNFGYREEGKTSSIMEVTEDGETVLDVDLTDFPASAWAYRAERFSLYNDNWTYQLG